MRQPTLECVLINTNVSAICQLAVSCVLLCHCLCVIAVSVLGEAVDGWDAVETELRAAAGKPHLEEMESVLVATQVRSVLTFVYFVTQLRGLLNPHILQQAASTLSFLGPTLSFDCVSLCYCDARTA